MRDPLDRYYTPQWAAEAICRVLVERGHLSRHDSVWEAHAGRGVFLDTLTALGVHAVGTDIAPERDDIAVLDALDGPPVGLRPSAIVGNPPFRQAEAHIRHFLDLRPRPVVAMLLRVGFLATQARRAFWENYPLTEVHVMGRRPSFTGGGTDSQEYALMVWARDTRQHVGRIEG